MKDSRASEYQELIPTNTGDGKLLKIHRKVAYATGNFITVLAVSLWFPYNILFFTKVVGLTPQNAGYVVLLGQVGGAISTPFIGTWSDQCRCKIPGRRKVFHLLGFVTVATVIFFLWYDCLGCKQAPEPYKVLYYGSFAIIFQFGWAATQIGQLALMPELTSQKKVLVELNSLRYCFTLIANILVFCCVWGLLEKFSHGGITSEINSNDGPVFWIMAIIIAGLGLLMSLPFQFLIPEKHNANLHRLKWYKWFANVHLYLAALILIGARYIVLMPQTYMSQYFLDTLRMDRSSIAKGPLILYISGFITSLFIVKWFRNFVGDKMTFFLGVVIVWGALIFFWVKDPTQDSKGHFNWHRDSIYIATILLGSGGTIVLIIALSMVAFLVKDYKGSSAFVYGWVLFCDRLSNGIGVYVIQYFTPNCDPKISMACRLLLGDYYRRIMVFLPFGASALGLTIISLMAFIEWRQKKRTPHSVPMDHPIANDGRTTKGTKYGTNEDVDVSLSYE